MPIKVTYTNQDINEYDLFEEIPDFNLVSKIICDNNKLTALPDNMNFPNLQEFYCHDNKLTSLPDNMNFPNLLEFYCHDNKILVN